MIQTLSVYIFLCLFMCIFLWNNAVRTETRRIYKDVYLWLSVFLFAAIFGMRYGVGIDYLDYLDYYQDPYGYTQKEKGMEFGFDFFSKLLYELGFHFVFFFGLISLAQISLIFYGIKKNAFVLPFVAFCLMTSGVALGGLTNVIRQSIAFAIFVYSIQFIANKSFIKYLLCVFLAVSMHVSAIILLPLYLLAYVRVDLTKNILIQLFFYVSSIIIAKINVFEQILNLLDIFAVMVGYEKTLGIISENQDTNLVFNIDFVLRNSIILVIILCSYRVKQYFSSRIYIIIYQLFFVGVILKQIFSGSMSLERLNLYFFNFFPIVAGFTLCYLFFVKGKILKCKIYYYSISMIFILLFFKDMYAASLSKSTSKYVFFYEKNRYKEKQIEWQNVVYENIKSR